MSTDSPPKVLVALRPTGAEPPGLREKVDGLADLRFVVDAGQIAAESEDVEAVFVWNFRSTVVPDAVHRLPKLNWVHVAAVGVDASLSDEVRSRGIRFTNSRGVTAESMAEFALSFLLAFAKDLPRFTADKQARVWNPVETRMLSGSDLVVVGMGAVSRELARRAQALGMTVTGVGRRPRTEPVEHFDSVVTQDELREVLGNADYVVLATPLTAKTEGMFGPEEFAAMSSEAVLVNIGRGPVVQEEALLQALRSGGIRGAALDVVPREPLAPDHELWSMQNVILTPHISADFRGWEAAMVDLFIDNLRRWIDSRPLRNVVDLEMGYAPLDT
ncbi:D-2-hydroxyacid dehydrogenase [Microbacterium sp. NPDC058342]|uniref:D-2-hydroxyacid dehydrogenase n=1 Tax=Microbacterium sp. NPDC058342 TaxID=3346454 RepID=UPI0036519740